MARMLQDSDDGSVAEDSASEFEYQDMEDTDSGGDADDHDEQMIIEPPVARKAPYTIMSRAELAERQRKCLSDASELLEVTQEESFVLLRGHSWELARLQEAWFQNEAKMCPICMSQQEAIFSLDCGHGFCQECWRGYLHSQVDEGKAAVQTRCPQHKCGRMVPASFFHRFCDEARQKKYEEWYLLSYVDDNPSVKWCTNPAGCPQACELLTSDPPEIRCTCTFVWCWACGEESHHPTTCKTVNQWNIKNSAESENIGWIRANTKKCPKCHKPIEKNQGCNHMICSKGGGCGHEFCWLCLGDWASHGSSTGGYYQCNIYDKQAKEGKHAEEEKTRQRAKHALDKYMFFFERFMDHDRGMKLTVREEQEVEGKVQKLHDKHGFDIIELQFLYDALKQVRACRRVLKWSYVYGYYLEEDGPEKNLFEHLQKHLEEQTDSLHEMLEKEFDQHFVNPEDSCPTTEEVHKKFMDFRSRVTNFTNVTQKFLTQIVTDLGSNGKLTGSCDQARGSSSTARR